MGRNVIFYLSEDDERLLEACEALGIIPNRSKWLREVLLQYALEREVDVAFEQGIDNAKAHAARLEALRGRMHKAHDDRDKVWSVLVEHFCARKNPSRNADVNWLRSRRKEIRFCRPGKTFSEVLGELTKARDEQ